MHAWPSATKIIRVLSRGPWPMNPATAQISRRFPAGCTNSIQRVQCTTKARKRKLMHRKSLIYLKPGKVVVRITNRNSFLNLNEYNALWSATDSDGVKIQSGALPPVDCAPGKEMELKILVEKIPENKVGEEFWLRVSFQTRTDLIWAPAGFEVAWQQFALGNGNSRGHSPSEKKIWK